MPERYVMFKGEDIPEGASEDVGPVLVVHGEKPGDREERGWMSRSQARQLAAELGYAIEIDGPSDQELEELRLMAATWRPPPSAPVPLSPARRLSLARHMPRWLDDDRSVVETAALAATGVATAGRAFLVARDSPSEPRVLETATSLSEQAAAGALAAAARATGRSIDETLDSLQADLATGKYARLTSVQPGEPIAWTLDAFDHLARAIPYVVRGFDERAAAEALGAAALIVTALAAREAADGG